MKFVTVTVRLYEVEPSNVFVGIIIINEGEVFHESRKACRASVPAPCTKVYEIWGSERIPIFWTWLMVMVLGEQIGMFSE